MSAEGKNGMRVLQITAFSGWGCTGRIAVGIHNALTAENCESKIAWGRINTAPDTVPTIRIGNKPDQYLHGLYTRLTDGCGFGSKRVTTRFLEEITAYQPDLIQLHIMHGYYINLEELFEYIKCYDIPVVWTFHDCWAFTGHCPYFDLVACEKWKTGCYSCPQKRHHPASWIVDRSQQNWNRKRLAFTGVNRLTVVTPSEWMANLVRQSFFGEYSVKVILNGVDTNAFKPTSGTIIKELALENKKIVLGVSSSWAKSKGLLDFVELANILPEEYQVVLVGVTKKQKAALPGNVVGIERTDSIRELAELYTAAEVFVNLTYEDNYPTTNLEALACGTPVITYKTGGSVEAVQKSGSGAVVAQGDIQAVKRAIQNLFPKSVDEAKRNVWDAEVHYQKYVELYNEILER